MKIAVATNDQQHVTGHIGRCKSFMVFDIRDSTILNREVRINTFTNHGKSHSQDHAHGYHNGHSHTGLIEGLKDCSYLISHGGGWRVVEDLKKQNITTIFTHEQYVDIAVEKFLSDELKNEVDLVCKDHQ